MKKFATLTFAVIAVDQVAKVLFAGDHLNTGMVLGFGGYKPDGWWPFVLFGGIAISLLFVRPWWAAALFFAGGISNTLDRIVLGGVRDWIPSPFDDSIWNLADLVMIAGAIVCYIYFWLPRMMGKKIA